MNKHADKDSLLTEVLAEASPADFRATMLAETLRQARRRRHFRQARQAVGALTVMSLLAVFMVQRSSTPPVLSIPLAKMITKPSCELVRTRPLPADAIVGTRCFPETGFAASVPRIVEVATSSGGYKIINDDELLALLADKPAVLVRTGSHSEELVFANPEDRKKLLVNY
jgi:hypothetical protein